MHRQQVSADEHSEDKRRGRGVAEPHSSSLSVLKRVRLQVEEADEDSRHQRHAP
jgi:hypothetical protein